MTKPPFHNSDVITIKCALGLEWDIKEARETRHGFDLYYGRRTNAEQYYASGPYRLIYTNELKAFWEQCALKHDGTIFDLPAGRTTLKRARIALGFNWDKDSQKFWSRHKEDLKTLTPRQFEKKHAARDLTGNRMSAWRLRMIGGKARPLEWWRKPEVLKLLLSGKTIRQIRSELGEKISPTHASRLRTKAKRAYRIINGTVLPISGNSEQQPCVREL